METRVQCGDGGAVRAHAGEGRVPVPAELPAAG